MLFSTVTSSKNENTTRVHNDYTIRNVYKILKSSSLIIGRNPTYE